MNQYPIFRFENKRYYKQESFDWLTKDQVKDYMTNWSTLIKKTSNWRFWVPVDLHAMDKELLIQMITTAEVIPETKIEYKEWWSCISTTPNTLPYREVMRNDEHQAFIWWNTSRQCSQDRIVPRTHTPMNDTPN